MKKLEVDIEEAVCEAALKLGVTNTKMGQNGYPDRIFFIPGGRPFFVEFKKPDGALATLQKVIIRRLKYYGYDVETHDNIESAIAAIKARLDASRLPKESGKVPARTRRSGAVT